MNEYRYGKAYNLKIHGKFLASLSGEEFVKILKKAAEAAGATCLNSVHFDFEPKGASGLLLLQESHYGFHSWPETNVICAVFYTCGQVDSSIAIEYIAKELKVDKIVGMVYDYDEEKATNICREY